MTGGRESGYRGATHMLDAYRQITQRQGDLVAQPLEGLRP
jgi:hypothetical protein